MELGVGWARRGSARQESPEGGLEAPTRRAPARDGLRVVRHDGCRGGGEAPGVGVCGVPARSASSLIVMSSHAGRASRLWDQCNAR